MCSIFGTGTVVAVLAALLPLKLGVLAHLLFKCIASSGTS